MDMNLGKFWELVRDGQDGRTVAHGLTESDVTGWLNKNNNPMVITDLEKLQH